MASQITETIGLRSFELVRDQIGAILYDELPNQATLNGDTRLNSEVFVERFRPVADEEVKKKSIIVVELSQGDYNMKTITSQDGMYIFNIDCYEFGFSTSTTRGDKTASVKLQRLLGVVQGILSHPKYSTLGFQSPFIEHTEVSGFKIGDPTGKKDAASMVLGRIEFKVRVPDKLNGSAPVPIDGYTTQALLGETALGYTYGTQTLPPVEPVCQGVEIELNGILIVNAESGVNIDIPVKDTTGAVVGSWNGSEFIVPANAIDNYDITINGSTFETINSNTDIPVKDTTGAAVGSKVGIEWIVQAVTPPLNVSSLNKTGAASFLTNDDGDKAFGKNLNFNTLDGVASDWPHNSLERFTDDQLTQVYLSDVVIDWSTYNQINGSVMAYYRVLEIGRPFANQASLAPFTKNSLTGWDITNNNELLNIFDYSIIRNFTNYSPFNISVVVPADRIWTSSMESISSCSFYYGRGLSQGNVTSSYKVLLRRDYTLSELGL